MADNKDIVIVTGSSGFIGEALVAKLAGSYDVIGIDLRPPKKLPDGASFQEIDVTSDKSVQQSLQKLRKRQGGHIASVIHLAAYFDLTGEPNPKYADHGSRDRTALARAAIF